MELIKRISGYTIISAITGGVSFLLLPVLTQYLTPEDYGVLSIFNATIRFLSALIPLGIGNLLLVYLIEKKDAYPIYLKVFIKITFSTTLLLTIIIGILYFLNDDFFGLPFVLTICLPLASLMVVYFETVNGYFVYLNKFKYYAKLTLSKFIIEIILVLLLVVLFPFNWQGRILSLVISLILILIYVTIYFLRTGILNFNLKSSNKHSKSLIIKGFPLIFMGISIVIMNLSDRFFIEYYIGLKETGIYGIASTVAGILLMIIGALMNVIRPVIYEKIKTGLKGKKYLRLLTFKYIISLFIISLLLIFTSKFIFKWMINEAYNSALPIVYPLIFGLFFWGVYNYLVSFLMYKKLNNTIGVISIFGILINLILNYFFILKFKTIGAAYATLITYFVICLLVIISSLFLRLNHTTSV